MVITLVERINDLPNGTTVDDRMLTFNYKAFVCPQSFFLGQQRFNWLRHIDETFYKCFEGTMNRFMKVV